MKLTLSGYTFSASAKTITFSGTIPTDVSQILHITNVTRGVLYFQPQAGSAFTGTYSSPTLTLAASTTGHSDSDKLFILYEDGTIYSRGSGNVDANTLRSTLAGNDPAVLALGAQADAAATSDSGTFSIIALIKRGLGNWTTLLGRIPASISGRVPVDGSGVTQPVSGPLTDTQLRASAVTVSPNVQLNTGVVTATTQRVTLATDGPGVAALTSIDNKTATLQSGAVPVGDNSGSLTVDGRSYRSTVTITRPSNTTAYTALDVIGIADSGTPANAGSAIVTLSSAGPTAGWVLVQSISLIFSDAAVISGMAGFRVHFYASSPTAILDNAPFDLVSGDRTAYSGFVDLPTPTDLGSTLYCQTDAPGRVIKLASASTSLFAQIQTLGTYTPASGSTVELRVNLVEMGL